MKLVYKTALLFLLNTIDFPVLVFAQTDGSIYQLKEKIKRFELQQDYLYDTAYANALTDLAYIYSSTYPDSALMILAGNAEHCQASGYKKGEIDTYIIMGDAFQTKGKYDKALENYEKSDGLAKDANYQSVLPLILNRMGMIYLNQGNYPEALSKFYESRKVAEAINNKDLIGATLNNIAIVHFYQGKFKEAESAYWQRLKIAQEMRDTSSMSLAYNSLGEVNLQQKNPAKALHNLAIAYNLALKINDQAMLLLVTLTTAEAYYESDSLQKAVSLFEDGLRLSKQMDNGAYICNALIGLAKTYYKQGILKEALANGLEGLERAEKIGQVQLIRDANEIVSNIYEALNEGNNALKYYRAYKVYSDSLNNLKSERAAVTEKANYEFSKKENEFQRKNLQQRWIIISAFTALLLLAIILWLINRNRKRLNHTNKELQKKNKVIETQKIKAEETLIKLKSAQAQLIQSEKMASLGELTAGIAHEIQNPLNFVNNFSDVNRELLAELSDEIEKENYGEVKAIANDVIDNEEKINHHGKRAEAIVKGMLQHSRTSAGQKEPTDINKLADEYLRLAYHGLRAKDKSFNATLQTDFDESIGNINVIPQDIGRVLLNLFNNAFYAVTEKKKTIDPEGFKNLQGLAAYEPTVSVSTKKISDKVEIVVKDNGNGIPQKVVDKIFQPFFTTKPTGQGTGLGLSLSYDIIKAHGGQLKVETKEGCRSEFIITLPS